MIAVADGVEEKLKAKAFEEEVSRRSSRIGFLSPAAGEQIRSDVASYMETAALAVQLGVQVADGEYLTVFTGQNFGTKLGVRQALATAINAPDSGSLAGTR